MLKFNRIDHSEDLIQYVSEGDNDGVIDIGEDGIIIESERGFSIKTRADMEEMHTTFLKAQILFMEWKNRKSWTEEMLEAKIQDFRMFIKFCFQED